MAALLATEDVARATDLEVGQRDLEPSAQLGRVEDRLQPLSSDVRELAALAVEKVRVGAPRRSTDTAAQLVQLRQPQRVSTVDDDRVGIGNVESGLDDRR